MTTTNKMKPANLPTPPKKKRKKRTKRLYFTQVHEDAILEYVKTESVKVRTELYVKYLGPIWLTTILDKYDPNKGSKAFSYFSVITKNWFIHQTKKRSKKRRTEVELSVLSKDLELKHISITNPYDKEREAREFLGLLRKEIVVNSLNSMRVKYRVFRHNWDKGDL